LENMNINNPTRQPLAMGNKYQFKGYNTGIVITGLTLPGNPNNTEDTGAPGVGVEWVTPWRKDGGWYLCDSEEEFWDMLIFSNAYDPAISKGNK